jgi:predicted NAD-dependent protein-ADP-ribosyltransferase YbiA (DUF1768 family)
MISVPLNSQSSAYLLPGNANNIVIDGKEYNSVLNYYTYRKFKDSDPKWANAVLTRSSERTIVDMGDTLRHKIHPKWDAVKYGVMKKAYHALFQQHKALYKKFVKSKSMTRFISNNSTFWCTPLDNLAKLLNEVRGELLGKPVRSTSTRTTRTRNVVKKVHAKEVQSKKVPVRTTHVRNVSTKPVKTNSFLNAVKKTPVKSGDVRKSVTLSKVVKTPVKSNSFLDAVKKAPVKPTVEKRHVKTAPVKKNSFLDAFAKHTVAEPADEPVEPADEPVEPADEPVEPVEPAVEPADEPVEPADEPVEPVEPAVEPADAPVEPTVSMLDDFFGDELNIAPIELTPEVISQMCDNPAEKVEAPPKMMATITKAKYFSPLPPMAEPTPEEIQEKADIANEKRDELKQLLLQPKATEKAKKVCIVSLDSSENSPDSAVCIPLAKYKEVIGEDVDDETLIKLATKLHDLSYSHNLCINDKTNVYNRLLRDLTKALRGEPYDQTTEHGKKVLEIISRRV